MRSSKSQPSRRRILVDGVEHLVRGLQPESDMALSNDACLGSKILQADSNALALRPKDAAQALGIGQRLLWQLTKQGRIPHLRLGRCVVYPVDALIAWLERQTISGSATK